MAIDKVLRGIPFLRQELTKIFMKRAADKSGIMTVPFKNKKLQLDIEDRVQKYIRDAQKQGVDLDMVSNENLKYTINLNENVDPLSRAISADSPEGRKITEALLGKQKAPVVDINTGKTMDTSQGIMGGKSMKELMESGQVTKGTEGIKKSKKVKDREMFEGANKRLRGPVKEKQDMGPFGKLDVERDYSASLDRPEFFDPKALNMYKETVKTGPEFFKAQKEQILNLINRKKSNMVPPTHSNYKLLKKSLQDQEDALEAIKVTEDLGGNENMFDFLRTQNIADYKSKPLQRSNYVRNETEQEIANRLNKQNEDSLQNLKNKLDDPEDMADGGVAGLLGERPGYVDGGSTNPFMPMRNFDLRPFQKAPPTEYSNIMDKQSVYTPFFSGRIKDEFDEKTQTAFDEGAKISRSIPFDFTKDKFDKQGYPSDMRHGLGTSAFKDAVIDYVTSNTPLNSNSRLANDLGIFAANAGSLFTEVPDIFSQAKEVSKSKGPYSGIDDYDDELDTRFLTQPIEDIKANYVGSKIPFSLRNNLKGKKYFIDNFNKYGSNTMNQLKLNQERAMQDQIKKAAAKAAAEKSQQKIRQAQTTALAQRNRDSGRGGYQSSFSQDKGFMGGSGTAAEMGSFAEGGPARQNFKMGKRAFLKFLASGAAGIAGLKSGLLGLGKGGAKKAVTETVKQSATSGTPPPYFFKLVEKIKTLGDDVTKKSATQEREVVTRYKDFELTENITTGEKTIQRMKIDNDLKYNASEYYGKPVGEETYMNYRPGKSQMDKTTKGKTPPDEYTEDTSLIRSDKPAEGEVMDTFDGVPDDILEEVGETIVKKADGGRIGLSTGGLARMLGE